MNQEDTASQDPAPTVSAVTSGQTHTKGPWFVVKDFGVWYVKGSTVDTVAKLYYPPNGSADANGRLIAASPEIYDALEPFADIAGEGSDDFPDETPVVVKFGRTTNYSLTLGDFRRASTALAKADGLASVLGDKHDR